MTLPNNFADFEANWIKRKSIMFWRGSSTGKSINSTFDLKDLKSRTKNFILLNIEKPDDELIFAIILKNLSDRQITLDDKFIEFIIKRIERSYSKIYDFIYKIDQLSFKKKKSIDFKIIKEVLENN